MLFNSIPYFIFFPIVLALFWLAPKSLRRGLLLIASYVFYMSWIPLYGALIAGLTAVNYGLALGMDRWRNNAKALFLIGTCFNLGALCYFKYFNFVLSNIMQALGFVAAATHQSLTVPDFTLDVILPLGISFFAFEFIHYLTDVYRGGKPIRGVVDFALFAAFFPSQLAGPIKRYQDFVLQLAKESVFKGEQFNRGIALLLQGLFKKVALADNLALIATRGFSDVSQLGTSDAWLTVLAFTLQIYFDFSGYTDMGRGSALMLGFELPDNFNFPYLARNLQDFWKRWHISLSSWLRDYLYVPLGGNRKGEWSKHKNLVITMVLGGLWHGAAWHFVAWGAIHGIGLVINHIYDRLVSRVAILRAVHATKLGTVVSSIMTLAFVMLCWIFFRADTCTDALLVVRTMFYQHPGVALTDLLRTSTVGVALAVYALYALIFCLPNYAVSKPLPAPAHINLAGVRNHPVGDVLTAIRRHLLLAGMPSRIAFYSAVVLAIVGFAPSQQSPFIYFQF
jgi:alginate O-acetyltransferase complex protein AlgI